ncbi:MAG: glycosyltransferase [Spirochaetota bacterium]|nr:glycosyltransferase [Spirochaetota bacterium]
MKISIVTPSFNQGSFIEETINSIWMQEGDFELEHIIADGGSTDNSVDIIKKYDKLYKEKIYPFKCKDFSFIWWSKKDNGQSDALNQGFQIAKGNIFGWLNSDDTFFNKDSLYNICRAFNENPHADLVVGNSSLINEKNKPLKLKPMINNFDNLLFNEKLNLFLDINLIPQPSCLFLREIYEEFNIENYHYVMDWDFWIKCYLAGKKFIKINKTIANLRTQRNAKTTIMGPAYRKEIIQLLNKYNPTSRQILLNKTMLINESFYSVPLIGSIYSKIFRGLTNLYFVLKYKLFKNTRPPFMSN